MKKTKVVAMIPARLGSKRIKNKNLRILHDKPLVEWVIQACKKANCFDEIYLNSDAPRDSAMAKIAERNGIEYYYRADVYATDTATNDDFVYDFLLTVDCDAIVQILPTSPFLKSDTIKDFTYSMIHYKRSYISVKYEQISCNFQGKPLNYNPKEKLKPSQHVEPVEVFACGLMGWWKDDFFELWDKGESPYYSHDRCEYFNLKRIESVDIDNEEDWELAEHVAYSINSGYDDGLNKYKPDPIYEGEHEYEVHVPDILDKDGIEDSFENVVNYPVIHGFLDKIKEQARLNSKSFCWRFINTKSNSATVIAQNKGEGNRKHYHPLWDEWWFILQGEYEYEYWVGDVRNVERLKEGDIAFMPRGRRHKITVVSEKKAIRVAVSRGDVTHVYS